MDNEELYEKLFQKCLEKKFVAVLGAGRPSPDDIAKDNEDKTVKICHDFGFYEDFPEPFELCFNETMNLTTSCRASCIEKGFDIDDMKKHDKCLKECIG